MVGKSAQVPETAARTNARGTASCVLLFKPSDNCKLAQGEETTACKQPDHLVVKGSRSSPRLTRKKAGPLLVYNNCTGVSKHSSQDSRLSIKCDTETEGQPIKDNGWAVIRNGRTRSIKKSPKKPGPISNLISNNQWRAVNTLEAVDSKGLPSLCGKLEWDEKGRPRWRVESAVEDNSDNGTVVRKPLAYLDEHPYTKWSFR